MKRIILNNCALVAAAALTTGCLISDDTTQEDAVAAPLNCDEVDRTQDAPELTAQTGEVALSGTLRVNGRLIYAQDQRLTIAPGTVFLMEPNSSILMGWRSDPARVQARGEAERPILFCGTQKRAGHWQFLEFLGGTKTESVLEHVRIEDAGKDGAALKVTVDMDLRHVGVYNSGGHGMRLEGLGSGSENLTVTGSARHALELHGPSAINHLPSGSYTGNGEDVAWVSGFSNTNVVFQDRGIPYRQTETSVVFGQAGGPLTSITLEAGVEYQFCQDCYMSVGFRSDPGAIYALGTEENPVRLTSWRKNPAPGDWDGINLLSGTTSDSEFSHTVFEYGGKLNGASLTVDRGSGTVRNSHFAYSAGYAIKVISSPPGTLRLENNTFDQNALGDVQE